MKSKIKTLLLVLLLSPLALSAKTFYPGYLLLKNGEKKEGLISYSPSRKNASTVFFKTNKEAAEEEYNASGTSEFYIEPYTTFFIAIFEKATKKIVFTEVMQRGALTWSTHYNLHVLSKKDDTLQLYLPVGKSNSVQDIEMSGKLEARANGLIKVFLADCLSDELNKLLSSSKINTSTLNRVVETYNQCKGEEIKKKKGQIKLGLVAGLFMSPLKFENPIFDYFDAQPSYKAGVSMDLVPAEFSSKLALNVQLVLANNVYKLRSSAHPSLEQINVDHLTLRLPVSFKIFLKPGQTGFFISPGISSYWILNPPTNKETIIYYQVPSGVFLGQQVSEGVFKTKNSGVTIVIGIGWEYSVFSGKHMSISTRYEMGSSPFSLASSYSSYQVDLAFRF